MVAQRSKVRSRWAPTVSDRQRTTAAKPATNRVGRARRLAEGDLHAFLIRDDLIHDVIGRYN